MRFDPAGGALSVLVRNGKVADLDGWFTGDSDPIAGIKIRDTTGWRYTREVTSNEPEWNDNIDFSDYDVPRTVGSPYKLHPRCSL